jgi:hypothetical protein
VTDEEPEFIIFDRKAFLRWWRQPTVGGTQHEQPAPVEVDVETLLRSLKE